METETPQPGSPMRGARLRLVPALAAALALALLFPSSGGAVTVGAPLDAPVNLNANCQAFSEFFEVPSCTLWGNDAAGAWTSQTPKGNWTIVRARVRTGPATGPMTFTVIRALRSQAGAGGLICCSSPAESPVFTPPPNSIVTVPVNMPVVNTIQVIDGEPVEVVDYLGISLLNLASSLPLHEATSEADPAASAGLTYFIPAMRAGQEAFEPGSLFGYMPLVNADYEPAATTAVPPGAAAPPPPLTPFSLLPRVNLLPGGTRARLGVNAPGPGLLRALAPALGGARVSELPAVRVSVSRRKGRGKGKSTSLLVPAQRRIKQAGKAYITVKLSETGKARLRRRGKLTVPIRLTFTPDGGSPVGGEKSVTFRQPAKANGKRPGR